MGQRFETRYRPTPTGPEVVGQSTVSPMTRLDFRQVLAVREAVAAFAAERDLSPAPPAAGALREGWTAVFLRDDGAQLRVREDDLGRWVQVEVREGRRGDRLRQGLAEWLGVATAAAEAAGPSPGALRSTAGHQAAGPSSRRPR